MTEVPPPIRKTLLISGDIQIAVEDDRLEASDRNRMAIDLLKQTCDMTLEARKKMGFDK